MRPDGRVEGMGSRLHGNDGRGAALRHPSFRRKPESSHPSPADTTHTPGDPPPRSRQHHLRHIPNDRAYWRNIPAAVWSYKLGGYQVLKKWLSYREHKILGRSLNQDEVLHFTNTARRIAAIIRLVTS